MSEIVYLSLGSNIGDREDLLLKALAAISQYSGTSIVSASSIYETEPVNMEKEDKKRNFLNLCCAVQTSLDPFEMLELIRKTEQRFGRKKTAETHFYHRSRTIDIDIILYGERIIYTKELILPHPRLHERLFVLEPLSEIAGNILHPLFRLTVNELKYKNVDKYFVKSFKELRRKLMPIKELKVFNQKLYNIIQVIGDTIVPSGGAFQIGSKDVDGALLLDHYIDRMSKLQLKLIKLILYVFEYTPMLTKFKKFSAMTPEQRLSYLLSWENSRFLFKRNIFLLIKMMIMMAVYSDDRVSAAIDYIPECLIKDQV